MQLHNQPSVSVIIVNFNGERYLANCLTSVLNTAYSNLEVILVDNGSSDSSMEIAQAFKGDSRLKLVQSQVNVGFSGGNNLGFNHSSGDYIAFLNNDTIVEPDWLSRLVEAMQNDDTIGLAQSKILTIDGKKIQTVGWLFSNYLITKHQLCENKPCTLKLQPVFEISFVCGASMIIKRELVDEIGLFDSTIPFYYDDTLLSLKAWLAGKRVVTVSNSKIRHVGGASSAWNIELITLNLLKAKICLMFDTYYHLDELARAISVNVLSTTVNALFSLKRKNIEIIYANTQGFVWGLKNFRYLWQNRLNRWSKSKISAEKLKEKFVRISLPLPFYVMPSKLANDSFVSEVIKYEKKLLQVCPILATDSSGLFCLEKNR